MQWEMYAVRDLAPLIDESLHHWVYLAVTAWFGLVAWALWCRNRGHVRARRSERLLREELEAYARLDANLVPGADLRALAKRVCRMVAEKSAFQTVALLLQDADGRLYIAGSVGWDPVGVGVLADWATEVAEQEHRAGGGAEAILGSELPAQDGSPAKAVLVPLRHASGRFVGALAVCCSLRKMGCRPATSGAVAPLRALAAKLGRMLDNLTLTERLVRVEKLAGLGQLAGGVAHELNNPLTAVLGFAELIAETASEARVREDANLIVTQALRMREIVENLVNFWRPVAPLNQIVELGALLRETVGTCGDALRSRGIALVLVVGDSVAPVRGDAKRLRHVIEHLLNNAAEAIRRAEDRGRVAAQGLLEDDATESPTIRVTLSHMGQAVHLVVSDTGTGFADPARAFDPFYTTRAPGAGIGLGLSICYGIVREHGGEISAFNLHPHGAAVVVELPVHRLTVDDAPETSTLLLPDSVQVRA
jgi:signal transduction histidine kinase